MDAVKSVLAFPTTATGTATTLGPIKLIIPYHISPATFIALFPHFGLGIYLFWLRHKLHAFAALGRVFGVEGAL